MTTAPAAPDMQSPADSQREKTELFQLAATLAGCRPIELVDVSLQHGTFIVIGLATGQQFTFSPATLGAEVTDAIRAQLDQVLARAPLTDRGSAVTIPASSTVVPGSSTGTGTTEQPVVIPGSSTVVPGSSTVVPGSSTGTGTGTGTPADVGAGSPRPKARTSAPRRGAGEAA